MTTDNSACSRVCADYVRRSERTFVKYRGNGVALAVPEVGLDARKKILELGHENSFFCVASFTTEEMKDVKGLDLLRNVDLLAANIDEAAAASGFEDRPVVGRRLVDDPQDLAGRGLARPCVVEFLCEI